MSGVGRSGLRAIFFTAFAAGTLAAGCGQDQTVACTGRQPSLRADVAPVAFQRCAGENCHGYAAPQAAYDQLVNAPAALDRCGARLLVDPGNVGGSYLINKLTGNGMCPSTQRMPAIGDPLTAAQIQTVADWICSGAPNN